MKLLNTETPVTRNFIPQILLNAQDFYFNKVGYTSYDEGILTRFVDYMQGTSQREKPQAWLWSNQGSVPVLF
jgi:hypothetical protein